ncbi:uncharacterized protein TM35_000052250 [Trypanosoma theileri]|uniref:Uncharacterized protein n=1 Tax=Trypanosoma theileri TaxID=67003 RepID=A0A1X0P512_9TRYP|nr:uncharacterized protein TM35_000052250 [Trypanosoma theileri]ORC91629.1 hypothetical protein TM35_000052250 [Trypanosoma theileri]
MDGGSQCWLHVEHSTFFFFHATWPITINSIHLKVTPKQLSESESRTADTSAGPQYILWAKCTSGISAADGVLCDQPPFILASFSMDEEGVSTASSLKWDIREDSLVYLCLTGPSESPEKLQELTKDSQPLIPKDNSGELNQEEIPNLQPSALELHHNITITLIGVKTELNSHHSGWRALLCFRWFELQEHIREATPIVSHHERNYRRRCNSEKTTKRSMITGDVREAIAVSSCGNYVMWRDRTLGMRKELMPYHRIFTPCKEEKRVRVRKFPHRFADIVGEVPFGTLVEAIGRERDQYTGEEYVLLILSGLPNAEVVAETYGLTCIESGKWMWGWSKIRTSSGLHLLAEVRDEARTILPGQSRIERLKEPVYYTSVREERSVRIRSGPSLSAEVIGHLEPNEVKVAIAIHHTTPPPNNSPVKTGNSAPLLRYFVEWEDGGFSLLRNNDRVYLVPVQLRAQPRLFPVCPKPTPKSPEIIALNRKRFRSPSGREEKKRSQEEISPEESLWSPSNVPEAVAAGVKAGNVRMEDLPPINLGRSSTPSSSFSSSSSNASY